MDEPVIKASIQLLDGQHFTTQIVIADLGERDPDQAISEAVLDLLQSVTQFVYESGLVCSMSGRGHVEAVDLD